MILDHARQPSLMDEPGASRLTFNGALALAGVGPGQQGLVRFTSLAGASVRMRLPAAWTLKGISAHVSLESRERTVGFQRSPRGSSILLLLGEHESVHPGSIVSIHGGKMAHYTLDWGSEAVAGFTIWQGPWSDVYTSDYDTFEEALAGYQMFVPHDSSNGAAIVPPGNWKPSRDDVTIDAGELIINLEQRDEAMVPAWPGLRGAHVELYRGVGGADERVLAVSESALAVVGRTTGQELVADHQIAEMAAGLEIEWRG